jgi:hypothetical protein
MRHWSEPRVKAGEQLLGMNSRGTQRTTICRRNRWYSAAPTQQVRILVFFGRESLDDLLLASRPQLSHLIIADTPRETVTLEQSRSAVSKSGQLWRRGLLLLTVVPPQECARRHPPIPGASMISQAPAPRQQYPARPPRTPPQ